MLEKLSKSEFVMGSMAMLLGLLAVKLGVTGAELDKLIMLFGMVSGGYIAGRSYAKPREMQSAPVVNGNPL